MSTRPDAPGFPQAAIADRAARGAAAVYPDAELYGRTLFGDRTQTHPAGAVDTDRLAAMRLVPPVFVPHRMDKLIELGREPTHHDVGLRTVVGGFVSALPVYVSAFGSTAVAADHDLGAAVCRQAAACGIPAVIGENVVPVGGYRAAPDANLSMLHRVRAYVEAVPDGLGGIVVQQSTEDADAEVWNLVYSDPGVSGLLESGRLAFELKVGQGAKPGIGGMTLVDAGTAAALRGRYAVDELGADGVHLRHSSPGTFTEEVLRQQIRLMRNNYPRARVWVKLPPARDVAAAFRVAVEAGADAVTVDGAEAGTGWAPVCFPAQVGLPLAECLLRIGEPLARTGCLHVSGRFWEGTRVVKGLALGARAAGLGRAALIAAAADENGVQNLVRALATELRLLIGALGKYAPELLGTEDVWDPAGPSVPAGVPRFAEETR